MRKKLLITVGAALTALLLSVSCSKDFIEQNNPGTLTEGTRTIAVSFGPQTRTALDEDGVTPKFENEDKIMVANGHAAKVCSVSVDGKGNASFTTDLTGTLMAVYPVGAAKMNGDAIAGVNVSNVQDGTFANANICMAKNITGNEARFFNQTALLCITPAAGDDTQYIEVSAEGFEIANDVPTGATFNGLDKIRVDIPETDKQDKYFVSILAPDGLTVGDLTFSDGTNVKTFTGEKAATPIQAGTLCNVPAECWESPAPAADYVEIGSVKWATCNIGADTPTEKGWYFSWGNTEGYIYDNTNKYWVKASDKKTKLGTDGSFSTENYSILLDKSISPTSENDAARANWGGDWRMPTKDEFQALYDACVGENGYDKTTKPTTGKPENKGVYWCDNYDGVAGCLFYDGTNVLFFPAAGFGSAATLFDTNSFYWSSTYGSPFPHNLSFKSDNVSPQNATNLRSNGCPIRPVYGPASGSTVDDLKVLTDDSDKWQK